MERRKEAVVCVCSSQVFYGLVFCRLGMQIDAGTNVMVNRDGCGTNNYVGM